MDKTKKPPVPDKTDRREPPKQKPEYLRGTIDPPTKKAR